MSLGGLKRYLSFLFAFAFLTLPLFADLNLESSIKTLAESLVKDLRGRGIKKLAALDFRDIRGYSSALDPFIAEELVTQVMLVAQGEFTFIERRQLDRIISEQKLTSSAFFDQNSLSEVGKILGVDAVLTGTISDLGAEIKINARAVAVQTGEVFSAAAVTVKKEGAIAELLRQTVGISSYSQTLSAGMQGTPATVQVQASDVFFENHLVRITVSGAALSNDKRRLTLSLMIENLSKADLPLGLPYTNATGNCAMTVSDNAGNLLRVRNFDLTGIPCVYDIYNKKMESYAVFEPRSRSTIVAQFSNREPIGNLLSIGMEVQSLSGEKVNRFSAGISNIRVR